MWKERGLRGALGLAARHKRLTVFALVVLALFVGVRVYEAHVGGSIIVTDRGITYFAARRDASWLPVSARTALRQPEPSASAGSTTWRTLAPGFEIGEQPVLVGETEVDRLYLTRIDPARFSFEVRSDPGGKTLDVWMRELDAAAVINGSYYARGGGPATPVVIDGAIAGPEDYDATHGAFIASRNDARVVDLAGAAWRDALGGAEAAMVSYPLLLAPDGSHRAPRSRWLASRAFVAEDAEGRTVLGAAPEGFFTLYGLAEYLRGASLDLTTALNLDGGPVACLGVDVGGVRRMTYGHLEIQADGEAGPLRVLPARRGLHAAMPLVLAVFPRAAD